MKELLARNAACSSALMAFHDAMADLTSGRIEFAVVGGASNILRPQTSVAFQRLNMLSPEVMLCVARASVRKGPLWMSRPAI